MIKETAQDESLIKEVNINNLNKASIKLLLCFI